jgi:hypothetical protein
MYSVAAGFRERFVGFAKEDFRCVTWLCMTFSLALGPIRRTHCLGSEWKQAIGQSSQRLRGACYAS